MSHLIDPTSGLEAVAFLLFSNHFGEDGDECEISPSGNSFHVMNKNGRAATYPRASLERWLVWLYEHCGEDF